MKIVKNAGWAVPTKLTTLALAGILALGLGAAACGDDDGGGGPGPFDLAFNGEGFSPHEGQTVYLAVTDESTAQIIMTDNQVITGGGFWFYFVDLLEKSGSYRVDYYADVNSDGVCDPASDHAWTVDLGTISDAVTVDEVHTTNTTAASCDTFPQPRLFDLTFEGSGYSPHEGQTLWVTVYEASAGTQVDTDAAVVTGGAFGFSWTGALVEGSAYTIDFFADVDGDGTCTAGTDHVWRVELPTVTDDVTVSETHNISFTDGACDSF